MKDDAATLNHRKRIQAQIHSIKVLGMCVANHHHVCPPEVLDRKAGVCDCECHGESVL